MMGMVGGVVAMRMMGMVGGVVATRMRGMVGGVVAEGWPKRMRMSAGV